jgi:hypothetical protein
MRALRTVQNNYRNVKTAIFFTRHCEDVMTYDIRTLELLILVCVHGICSLRGFHRDSLVL